MTFVNHTAGGFAIGWILGSLFGLNPFLLWTLAIGCALIGAYPDVGSWVIWKLSSQPWWKWKKWGRWELYNYSHPPYDPVTGHGKVDRYMKWFPPWGFHTWVIDSIVHPTAPQFIFPKFNAEWSNIPWLRFGNKVFTKWDVLYTLLEGSLYALYICIVVAM